MVSNAYEKSSIHAPKRTTSRSRNQSIVEYSKEEFKQNVTPPPVVPSSPFDENNRVNVNSKLKQGIFSDTDFGYEN